SYRTKTLERRDGGERHRELPAHPLHGPTAQSLGCRPRRVHHLRRRQQGERLSGALCSLEGRARHAGALLGQRDREHETARQPVHSHTSPRLTAFQAGQPVKKNHWEAPMTPKCTRARLTLSRTFAACFTAAMLVAAPASLHAGDIPTFAVDASWPKPLPNNWILGQVGGITVDWQGHIWVIHRPRSLTDDEKGASLTPPRSKCCVSAPPVLEFDSDGNLLRSWGG